MSQDGTPAAQPDRLEADPLPVLPEFHGQEARQVQVAQVPGRPLQHGGLAAAGGTGQEQVLESGESLRLGWLTAHHVPRPEVLDSPVSPLSS